jgi:hypothetical protein
MTLSEAVRIARMALFSPNSHKELTGREKTQAYDVLAEHHAQITKLQEILELQERKPTWR